MFDVGNFLEFTPNQLFAEYIKFYTEQAQSAYDCFSKQRGGEIPARAIEIIHQDTNPQNAQAVCDILNRVICDNNEYEKQFNNFKLFFLPYFENLSDEFYGNREEEDVFLAFGYDVITYDQLYNAYFILINSYHRFAAEMGIDIWHKTFDINGTVDGNSTTGDDIYKIISFGEDSDYYQWVIFEAAKLSDEFIIPALINVFFHAIDTLKQQRYQATRVAY